MNEATQEATTGKIELSSPEQTVICCPSCSAELLRVMPDGLESLQEGYYLNDGDTIPDGEPTGTASETSIIGALMVGACKACNEHYYVIEVSVMGATDDVNFAYTIGEREAGQPAYAIVGSESVEALPSPWHVALYGTPDGPRQVHELGPFKVERIDDLKGEHGVSPCQGRGARQTWGEAAQTVSRLRPHFHEIARQQAAAQAKP